MIELELHPDQADDAGVRAAVGDRPFRVIRRAVDARGGKVRVKLRVLLDPPPVAVPEIKLDRVSGAPQVAIIGAGPAGLFAALELIRAGIPAVLFDRGSDVRGRRPHLARLNREGALNPESNYCYGEGGAGTFSDGKLYTRAKKRGPVREVLEDLVACGAPADILVDARPHIGTNRLPKVISGLRERLVQAGLIVRYDTRVDDLLVENGRVAGVRFGGDTLRVPAVVLATGHSARDAYVMCQRNGVALEAKPFALGVRVEHPQPLIDRIQYGDCAGHPNLGAAPYALKRTVEDVGTYSFCMCPGGFVVAAATEADGVVVNGMSPSRRDSRYANSGIVVSVGPEVFGEGPLAGVEYQRRIEQAAFAAGDGAFKAPAERLSAFVEGKPSVDLPECSYRPGLTPASLRDVLPPHIHTHLTDAIRFWDRRRMRGYLTDQAVIIGVESRSSAAVRVPRDETLQSSLPGLYPCGEGAGYAGGIVSAALDGRRVARAITPS